MQAVQAVRVTPPPAVAAVAAAALVSPPSAVTHDPRTVINNKVQTTRNKRHRANETLQAAYFFNGDGRVGRELAGNLNTGVGNDTASRGRCRTRVLEGQTLPHKNYSLYAYVT